MSVVGRIFVQDLKQKFLCFQKLFTPGKEKSSFATLALDSNAAHNENVKHEFGVKDKRKRKTEKSSEPYPSEYRFIYPEFLPDPNPEYRNALRERLERKDMLSRRSVIDIPEFYVGSILAVTHSDIHAPGKSNRFVGICIQKRGGGLRASFILRNFVDEQGVEVDYDLYDPCIQKIECLRLEKRLDDQLLYLRDAPPQYSTFPFDLEPELIIEGKEVPVNDIKVPLLPQPWKAKYELQDLKGVKKETIIINRNRTRKAEMLAKPFEKYDLMKIYRGTVPEEEQKEIFSEIYSELHNLQITRQKQKRARVFTRPKKTG